MNFQLVTATGGRPGRGHLSPHMSPVKAPHVPKILVPLFISFAILQFPLFVGLFKKGHRIEAKYMKYTSPLIIHQCISPTRISDVIKQ